MCEYFVIRKSKYYSSSSSSSSSRTTAFVYLAHEKPGTVAPVLPAIKYVRTMSCLTFIAGYEYFFFFIYNCESDQNLTNNEFLEKLYKDIDDEKPYGKNRIAYLELNDTTKTFYVKELIENLDCSIEKKIVIFDPNDKNKLYLISLKTIFKAIVEFNSNK